MIAKILSRRLISLRSLIACTFTISNKSKYSFSRRRQKNSTSFSSIIQAQIKAEEKQANDLSELEQNFKNNGWSIAKENTLVELTRNTGTFIVRLLSNIKPPSNFDQAKGEDQPNLPEEEDPKDINEVTICVTKVGAQTTMVINTVVAQVFEISKITFSDNYQAAKHQRVDIFNTNGYTGPEIETIADQLFDSLYGFLEQQCQVDHQTLFSFSEYCINSEHQFYIDWLKDLKSIL